MDYKATGSEDLWITAMPTDRGPEGNLKLWRDAEDVLDGLCEMYEMKGPSERGGIEYEGVHLALVDVYNRAIEERRRCEDLLKLHKWEGRPVGGVIEPEE